MPGDEKFPVRVVFFVEALHGLLDGGFVRACSAGVVVGEVGLVEVWHVGFEFWDPLPWRLGGRWKAGEVRLRSVDARFTRLGMAEDLGPDE